MDARFINQKKKDKKIQKIKKICNIEEIDKNNININSDIIIQNIELDPEDTDVDFSINDIEYLVNLLSDDRCNNYNDWVSIGMCLFNISPKYLLLWEKWSQKSDKYEEGNCEEKWDSFTPLHI